MNMLNDDTKSRSDAAASEQPLAKKSTAAERMRRHRARRRSGCRCITVEVADIDIDGLIRLRHLDPRDRNDLVAIGDALYRLFDLI
jgi:hypothetical protein